MTRLLWLGWVVAFLWACAPKNRSAKVDLQLPKVYLSDSKSVPRSDGVVLKWQEYFQDTTLKDLIGTALNRNYDLRVALERVQAVQAGVRRATGAQLPELGVGVGAQLRKFGKYTMDGAGNATTEITPGQIVPEHLPDLYLGLGASWEIDAWGRLSNLKKAALAQYLASIEGTHLVTTSIVADVATRYYELVALDQSIARLDSTLERQERALQAMRWQKVAGRVNELAIQQFESQLASTRALRLATKKLVRDVEDELNVLAARLPQRVHRSANALNWTGPSVARAGVPSDLLQNRPDIRAAELRLQSAECDLKAARAAFFPRLTLSGSVGLQAFNPQYLFMFPESLAYSVAGQLFAPLVNRAGIRADFEVANSSQIEAMYDYQTTVLRAFVEVANGLSTQQLLAELLEHRQVQREALATSVETADLLFRTGKANYLEVLSAQRNVLDAELQLIEAQKSLRVAEVDLYRALGGGWQ